jgi:hypothetical protein
MLQSSKNSDVIVVFKFNNEGIIIPHLLFVLEKYHLVQQRLLLPTTLSLKAKPLCTN